jgi:hypothetical protein
MLLERYFSDEVSVIVLLPIGRVVMVKLATPDAKETLPRSIAAVVS